MKIERWTLDVKFTFSKIPIIQCNCIGLPPMYETVNIPRFLKIIYWEALSRLFYSHKTVNCIAYSHDAWKIHFLCFTIALRRPCAHFQIEEKQHCKWRLCAFWMPFYFKQYETYLYEYCGEPSLADLPNKYRKHPIAA